MTQKMTFSIDSYKILEDNPLLALLELDIVSEGENVNQTNFSIKAIEDAAQNTLANIPILSIWNETENDFNQHAMNESEFKEQNCVGVIPESNKYEFVEKEVDGKQIKFLRCTAAIWKLYAPEVYEKLANNVDTTISMEILVEDAEQMENGILDIKKFMFSAISLLGAKFLPGITGANAKMIKYSSDEYNQMLAETNKQLQSFSIPQEVKDNAKKALEQHQTNNQLIQFAKELINSESLNYGKITTLFGKINNLRKEDNMLFYGGQEGRDWFKDIIMQFEKEGENVFEIKETYGLNSRQMEEILSKPFAEYKYKDGNWECNKYWVMCYDEEFVYVHDCEEQKDLRIKYEIVDTVATVDMESAEEVISAGFMPVGEGGDKGMEFTKEMHDQMQVDMEKMSVKCTEIQEKFDAIQAEYTSLQEKFTAMETENTKLENYKAEQLKKDEQIKMSAVLNQYSKILSDEDKKEFEAKMKEFSFTDFEKEVTAKVAKIALFAINNQSGNKENKDEININFAAMLSNTHSQEDDEESTLADKLQKVYK